MQINGWRTQSTKGVPVTDGMKISFHTQSLPTARLDGSCVIVETKNLGISILSKTTIKDDVSDLYVALTGDQCAITNIRFGQK